MEYRDYQLDIINKASRTIAEHKFVYLAMEVRTGKTLTALGIAEQQNCKRVLFLTKKKAIRSIEKDYEMLGYNTDIINGHKHRLYSYPLYLAIMVCIGSILMLNIKHNKSKIANITIGIAVSVIIYYVNYFFNVIIETQDVPYLTSIWGPQIILSMIIITNLIKINEK